jgi:CheY-like chemotaxis protein
MSDSPSVLIVEPSADEREVLCTVLARRGLRIWEAADATEGLALARVHRPDVIVIDADAQQACDEGLAQKFGDECSAGQPPLVILGRIGRQSHPHTGHVIAKPYHFGPLIHKIEQLATKAA